MTTPDGPLPVGHRLLVVGNAATTAVAPDRGRWYFLEDEAGRASRRQPLTRSPGSSRQSRLSVPAAGSG